jgi:hypothetical protein
LHSSRRPGRHFAVIEDSEDDGRRQLLQAKNNLGAKCNGLAFRLEQRIVDSDILSSNVKFEKTMFRNRLMKP